MIDEDKDGVSSLTGATLRHADSARSAAHALSSVLNKTQNPEMLLRDEASPSVDDDAQPDPIKIADILAAPAQ